MIDSDEFDFNNKTLCDMFTDELFMFDRQENIHTLVFPYSRFYCDVERYKDNSLEPMYGKGMGYIYTNLINGKTFRSVDDELIEEINPIYEHHHTLLKQYAIKDKNNLIIDCHSFSTKPLECDFNKTSNRPDICIGFNGKSPRAIHTFVKDYFEKLGFYVLFNEPFEGSITYNETESLMIEVNKSLYMNEEAFTKKNDFYKLKFHTQHLILKLIEFDY